MVYPGTWQYELLALIGALAAAATNYRIAVVALLAGLSGRPLNAVGIGLVWTCGYLTLWGVTNQMWPSLRMVIAHLLATILLAGLSGLLVQRLRRLRHARLPDDVERAH